MQLQFEPIKPAPGQSFALWHYTQARDHAIEWHYHPEYELVYIPAGNGRRHLGQHVSRYAGGELLLIGPNVPHLSFSYEQQGAFEQIVVQFREDFMGAQFWERPELAQVQQLLARSGQGLSFGAATRAGAGAALRQLLALPAPARLLALLQLLYQLAGAPDATALHASRGLTDLQARDQQRLSRVYGYIEQHYAEPVTVQALADLSCLTVPAFCRYFRKMTGQTLTDFLQEYRVSQATRLLLGGAAVAQASLASGFANLSHFNRTFRKLTGQSPSGYRQARGGRPAPEGAACGSAAEGRGIVTPSASARPASAPE